MNLENIPLDIIGFITLFSYVGKTPSILLVCKRWSTLPQWVRHELRLKRCVVFYGPYDNAWIAAVKLGFVDVLRTLHERKYHGCSPSVMNCAARIGSLETLQWLHYNCTEGCTADAMDQAAASGHLKTIMWLHENRKEGCTTNAVDWAAINGHLNVVKWLLRNRPEGFTTVALAGAARRPKVVAALKESRLLRFTYT